MIVAIISVCALVLAVVGSGVAVLTIFATRKLEEDLVAMQQRWDLLGMQFKQTEAAVERTTNSRLAAEVDALRGALDVLRASNRREFSTIHGRLGGRPRSVVIEGELADADDEVAAMVALQTAKPAGPGNGSA